MTDAAIPQPVPTIAVADIRTVKDLQNHLWSHPSPIAATLINDAIRFFSEDCRQPQRGLDWRAVKERTKLGLKFQLTPDHKLTPEIIAALRMWMCHMNHGRNIGNDLLDTLISFKMSGDSNPREVAFNLLREINDRLQPIPLLPWETGTVKFFDARADKRFGFIMLPSGNQIFFHYHAWFKVEVGRRTPFLQHRDFEVSTEEQWHVPTCGELIRFLRKQGAKGPKAHPWCFAEAWDAAERLIAERNKSITN